MKEEIKKKAEELHIDLIGFAEAQNAEDFWPFYEKRIQKDYFADVGGVGEVARRLRVFDVMAKAKTVIAVALCYNHPIALLDPGHPSRSGIISAHVFRQDYHQVMQQKMKALIAHMSELTDERFVFQSYCDTGVLDDRIWAWRAGLGFFGKNNFIIHPSLGSYLFLGHIVTDLPIMRYDRPMNNLCGSCRACIDKCESGALCDAYELNAKRCISNLTQKKNLREEEEALLGRHVYGCDVCQQVCPFNARAKTSVHACFKPKADDVYVSCDEIIAMDETSFREKYENTALYWRGYTIIKRNAKIVKHNIYSEEERQ